MKNGFLYDHLKKSVFCLAFLFTFLYSYSSVYNDHHVYLEIANETVIDSDLLDYSEFSLSSNGHLSECPENPAEGESDMEVEKEKENENETDDDKDEISGHDDFHELTIGASNQKDLTVSLPEFLTKGTVVPYYILFHSWKSFLA